MFKLEPTADVNGTSQLTMFECPPICFVELFGEPHGADGCKVSGEYVFTNEEGQVFTVYDWKETTLYWGKGNGAPTPKRFWHSERPKSLNIGGRQGTDPGPFIKWFIQKWEDHQKNLDELLDRLDTALKKAGAKNGLDDLAELYQS